MLRRLGILGLAVPLIAILVVLAFLVFFGTTEPTFDAATRELARDHTLVRLSDDPPTAMIVPQEPPPIAIVVVILPDDERHVWTATRELGLLEHVEDADLVLIPATGAITHERLSSLTAQADDLVRYDKRFLAAFSGVAITTFCEGPPLSDLSELTQDKWAGVIVVGGHPAECGTLPLLQPGDASDPAHIVKWMQELE